MSKQSSSHTTRGKENTKCLKTWHMAVCDLSPRPEVQDAGDGKPEALVSHM